MKHQPVKQGQTTTPVISSPTLSDKCVGSLTSPANHITLEMQETGPTVYSPYPRRLERLIICRSHYKGSTFSSDPECWSGRGLNLRPPAQQSGALPTELTGRRFAAPSGPLLAARINNCKAVITFPVLLIYLTN